jgi:hypothetical protein
MFGLFRKKIKAKEIIITNHGFHVVWNYCRDTFDHRLYDGFSDSLYLRIMDKLLALFKNSPHEDDIYDSIIDSFEIISPSGSPRNQFIEVAQKIAIDLNSQKNEDFKKSKRIITENKFTIINIQESIKKGKELGSLKNKPD